MPREKKGSLKNKNNCNDGNDNEIMGPKSGPNKKRRTSNVNNQNNNNNNNLNNSINNLNNKSLSVDMIPPQPMTAFGDTIIASNPFDDTPRTPVNPQTPQPLAPGTGPSGMLSLQQMTQRPQQSNASTNQSNNNMIPNNVSMPTTGGPVGPKPVPIMSGKIYPADKSMVFNPANPNAPPIYPCGVCHKEVHDNDQAILCESGCNFWYHRICSGLTDRAYFLLTQEVYAEWVCDNCANNKSIPLVKFKP